MPISKEKYKVVIVSLLKELSGCVEGKKKLAKLLYFIDFDFFELTGKSITNDTYFHREMGPLGSSLQTILDELSASGVISVNSVEREGYNPTFVYRLNSSNVQQDLTKDEQRMIERVARKYGLLNGKQLENITHAEAPYLGTEEDQEINYELSYYRGTEFGELDPVSSK